MFFICNYCINVCGCSKINNPFNFVGIFWSLTKQGKIINVYKKDGWLVVAVGRISN